VYSAEVFSLNQKYPPIVYSAEVISLNQKYPPNYVQCRGILPKSKVSLHYMYSTEVISLNQKYPLIVYSTEVISLNQKYPHIVYSVLTVDRVDVLKSVTSFYSIQYRGNLLKINFHMLFYLYVSIC
jgi:hypothetical protein